MTEKELVLFNSKYAAKFKALADLIKSEKQLKKDKDVVKCELEKAFDEYGIKSLDNDYLKITFIDESTSVSVDLKELQKLEPELYEDLLRDYPKETKRKAYVRFDAK